MSFGPNLHKVVKWLKLVKTHREVGGITGIRYGERIPECGEGVDVKY